MPKSKTDRTGPAGTSIRPNGKDGPQVLRTTGKRWSMEAERLFLDHLYATCNVSAAAAHAGFSAAAIYGRRKRDPAFAQAWQTALEHGCLRIETALVRVAADTFEGVAHDPDAPFPPTTVSEALAILKYHRAAVKGEGRRGGWPARPRSLDEMRTSILAKFDAIEAARVRS
jgi:hypothetical protein